MNERPTLSVVTANFNHARFLPEMLRAICDQSWSPIEIIVIDDCSTDASVAILEEFARHDPRIALHRNEKNRGVIYTANLGLSLAKGDYVYFAAADDKVLPGLFEKSMRLLAQYPQAGLCSSLSMYIDEEGRQTGVLPTVLSEREPVYLSRERCADLLIRRTEWIQGNATFYERERLSAAGGFREGLHAYVDGFVQTVLALQHGVCYLPEYLSCWRRLSDGYAATLSENPRLMMEVHANAEALMRGEFAGIFPAELVRRWSGTWRFAAVTNAWNRHRREQDLLTRQLLTEVSGISPRPARMIRVVVAAASMIETAAIRSAAFLATKSVRKVVAKRLRMLWGARS